MIDKILVILKKGRKKDVGQLIAENEIEKKYVPISDFWYLPYCEESYQIPSKEVNGTIAPIIQIA
jgi:hypothetical protein